MLTKPKISVLLPVFNSEKYIVECIESILTQTLRDFELIIIDDNSTDNTLNLINVFSDSRIILIQKEKNTGYTESLIQAIAIARGVYIARMDADDICFPNRFQKQFEYLNENPWVSLCGCDAEIIGSHSSFNYPQDFDVIKINLLFGSSLIHPTIMGKAEIFKQYSYNSTMEPAEDYDLFTRLAIDNVVLFNVNYKLLKYRVHPNQISQQKRIIQRKHARFCMLRMFKMLSYDRIKYSDQFVMKIIYPIEQLSPSEFRKGLTFFKSIKNSSSFYDEELLRHALNRKKYNLIKFYFTLNKATFIKRMVTFSLNLNLKYFIKINKHFGIVKVS